MCSYKISNCLLIDYKSKFQLQRGAFTGGLLVQYLLLDTSFVQVCVVRCNSLAIKRLDLTADSWEDCRISHLEVHKCGYIINICNL